MSGISGIFAYPQINSSWKNKNTGSVRNGKGLQLAKATTAEKTTLPTAATALETKNQSIRDYQEMRQKVRELHRSAGQKTGETEPKSLIEQSLATEEEKEEKVEKPVNYNYKEVSNKIQRAKTSVSAGQAFLAAKRKTLEIRRKIAAKEGDPEELQIALNHAKSMELVARKKKNHLELEEMVEHTQRRDEAEEKTEEAADRLQGTLISAEEETLGKREDEILQNRSEIMEDTAKELRESGAGNADEMLSELNEMLADLGEEQLKELEEAMEMLEDLEFLDPHMSEEELKEVKQKHRAAEGKAIVKADTDYLKAMIKHQMEVGKTLPGMSSGRTPVGAVPVAMSSPGGGALVSAPAAPSIDVQV